MIRILITGDFCPSLRIGELIESERLPEIYNDFLPVLDGNDVNITNLECPLVNRESRISKTGPSLRASEDCIKALVFGKFNLATLSNNHIMDQGEQGLISTIRLCEKNNIAYAGAGRNLDEASRIVFLTIGNIKMAFLNFSENEFSTAGADKPGSNPLDPVKNYYSIRSAREIADYVIVLVHGGHEMYPLPSPRMKDTYRFFIDAGADIVAGHHTHCFSGYEKYRNGFIFYSLGNFIFDDNTLRNSDWNLGYAVRLIFGGDQIVPEIMPFRQCDSKPGLFLLNETEKEIFDEKLLRLNNTITDNDLLELEWKLFVKQNKDYCLKHFEAFDSSVYSFLRSKKILPSLLSKNKRRLLLNIIRCEAHRDLATESLKE